MYDPDDPSTFLVQEHTVFTTILRGELHKLRQWHDSKFAFHISVKRALREQADVALPVMKTELQQMLSKSVWHPIMPEGLTKEQRYSVLRSR